LLGEGYSGGTLNGLALTNLYDSYFRRTQVTSKNGSLKGSGLKTPRQS
jgi:hypothetical protein